MATPTRLGSTEPSSPEVVTPTDAHDRLDRVLTRALVVACILLVGAGLGRSLLGLSAFTSTDALYDLPPWSASVGPDFAPANAYVGDPLDAVYPPIAEVVERFRAEDLAAWTSLEGGGSELGATPNVAVLSPATWPYFLLPLWLAPAYVKVLEIAIALAGMVLYSRRLGLGRAASWLGGLAFVTSGFMIAWTNWPQSRTAAFVPALFWALERLVQARTGRSVALVSLVVAALLFGGFPSVTVYALLTAAVYVLVRAVLDAQQAPGGRALRVLTTMVLSAAGVLGGLALAMVQLWPFLHQLGEVYVGARMQTPDQSLTVVSLATALVPDGLGTPVAQSTWHGPRNPIESFSYVGVAVSLLAAVGVIGLRSVRSDGASSRVRAYGVPAFFVVAIVVWGLAVYPGGATLAAIQHLPSMDVNRIGRARSVLGFSVAVLAAIGYDRLVRASAASGGRRLPTVARALGWALAAVGVAAVLGTGARYADAEGFSAVYFSACLVAGAWAVAAVLGMLLASHGRGRTRLAGLVLLPVVLLGQAAVAVQPWWPESPTESVYPATATHEFLAANLGSDRYLSTDDAMLPGSSLAYGLRSLDGHIFLRTDFADLLRSVDTHGFVAPSLWHPDLKHAAAGGAVLDRLGVRYLVTPPDGDVLGVHRVAGDGSEVVDWAPGRVLRVELDGSVRGVGVVLAARPSQPVFVSAQLVDASGASVSSTTRLVPVSAEPGPVIVPLVGAGLAGTPLYAELSFSSLTPTGPTILDVEGAADQPQTVLVEAATDDGLQIVHTGDTTIYERQTALPRIRWAGTVGLERERVSTIDQLRSRNAAEVVLAGDAPVVAPSSGAAATDASVNVLEDSGDTVRVRVDAAGDGYLVVADALGDTFTATVDGRSAELRTADHGYVAVAVPAGAHEVDIRYATPGGWWPAAISAVTLLLLLGLLLGDPRRRSANA